LIFFKLCIIKLNKFISIILIEKITAKSQFQARIYFIKFFFVIWKIFLYNYFIGSIVQWNLRTKNEFWIEPNRINSIFSWKTAPNLFEFFNYFSFLIIFDRTELKINIYFDQNTVFLEMHLHLHTIVIVWLNIAVEIDLVLLVLQKKQDRSDRSKRIEFLTKK